MHDGTGRFVNFYRVYDTNKRNNRPVIKVRQENLTNIAGDFSADSNAIVRLVPNAGFSTVQHEFGHVLGLDDLDEHNKEPYLHSVLMGYNRGATQSVSNMAMHYQDIQGAAFINEAHTNHQYTRYILDDEGRYDYLCFYCDIIYRREIKLDEGSPMIKADGCDHDYKPLVSAGDRHWIKCTKCYKVVESDVMLKVINEDGEDVLEVTGLANPNVLDVRIKQSYGGQKVTRIVNGAFINQTNIKHATIPNTVTSIGDNTFLGCTGLETISSINGVTSIGDGAFKNCSSLNEIVITNRTTHIGEKVFSGCSNLKITMREPNENYLAENNILYNQDKTEIIAAGKVASDLTIAASVQRIAPSAFEGNSNIEKLYIEGNTEIGNYAFADCANLTDVYCYSFTVPRLYSRPFMYDNFTLYTPHNKHDDYAGVFAEFTGDVRSIPITVTFNLNGELFDTIHTYYGATISELRVPDTVGHDFSGWYDNPGLIGTKYLYGGIWDKSSDFTLYATNTAQEFTIHYVDKDGKKICDQPVKYGEKIGEMPTVKVTGEEFLGWKDENNVSYTPDTVWLRTNDLTLQPNTNIIFYTLTFDGNGGVPGTASQNVTYGLVISQFPTATKSGGVFTHWNTAKDGSGQPVTAPYTYNLEYNLTLYAQYDMYHTVTYKIGSSIYDTQKALKDTYITLPRNAMYGYDVYWSESNGAELKEGASYKMPDKDVTFVKSRSVPRTYSVKLYINKKQGGNDYTTTQVTFGSKYYLPEVDILTTGRSGYHFVGWSFKDEYRDTDVLHPEVVTDETGESFTEWKYDYARDLIAAYCANNIEIGTYTRKDTYLITDSGRFNQAYDSFGCKINYNYGELYNFGYRTIRLTMEINISEKSDGYQGIMVYDGTSTSSIELVGIEIEHGGSKKDTSTSTYKVTFHIPLTANLKTLCIRYGARGVGNDDWYNSNVRIVVEARDVVLDAKAAYSKV